MNVRRHLRSTSWAPSTGERAVIGSIDSGLVIPSAVEESLSSYGKGIDEPSEWGHREMDGHACEGNRRDERQRTSQILERVAAGSVYYPQQNHEGSVTLLTDTSGNVIERYRYDAFGAPTIYAPNWATRSATIYDNRFLFTGREYAATYRSTTTPAFNFYEYRARAYSPKLGRFMSEDPKLFDPGDYNLFRYCHNDPIDNTDPMGTEIKLDPWYLHHQQAQALDKQEAARQMGNEAYNRGMANAQRTMHDAHGSAIGVGKAGYNTWSALSKALESLSMAQVRLAQRAPASITRWIFPGPRIDRGENGGYVVVVPWSLQLLDEHQKATCGEGIRVDERIEHSDEVNFASLQTLKGAGWTKQHGVVGDPWTLGFKGPNGAVTTRQTVTVMGHEAQWDARVSLIGGRDVSVEPAQLWAPFH
jgi:RHS repeat-associated protein